MKRVSYATSFNKDVKNLKKQGKDLGKLTAIVTLLATGKPLAERQRDHQLTGNWIGARDCHLEPDWILIYRVDAESVHLERTGSHSELFK